MLSLEDTGLYSMEKGAFEHSTQATTSQTHHFFNCFTYYEVATRFSRILKVLEGSSWSTCHLQHRSKNASISCYSQG